MGVSHRRREPLSIALGGGGAFGIAFHLGVLHALGDEGVGLRDASMTGVSAGGWAAAALVTGISLDNIIDTWHWAVAQRVSDGRTRVGDATQKLFGDLRDARVRTVAIRLPSCRRVVLDGAGHGLARAVATTSSPPCLAAPEYVGRRRVYDAGVLFNTAADLAPAARSLLVLAPLAINVLGRQGLMWEHRLRTETAVWRLRHGGNVLVVRPDRAVVQSGATSWSRVLDVEVMRPTYAASYEQGLRIAEQVRTDLGLSHEPSGRQRFVWA